ncbi:hypothetical protein C8Q72DRAFT_451091 [Fomitopsis betulina]|nr:hypothetical protein C8Q72DRAFT_451091 [Fomitopsis betulina]
MSGHHQPTGLHNGTDADDLHSKNMGIDPMVTVGAMPYEEEPQAEVQKKPGSRARSAGNKVKIEAMASSPIKAPSSRKGCPPPALTKTSASTIPKRAASPRKPASRSASPKKATTTKPVSASASTSASLATPFPTNRPAGPAPFQGQPYFSAASSSVQASPVRLTRSATREGTMTLPPITPPLPERRMASSRTAGAQPTPAGCQVPTSSQTAADPRPLPAYVAPTPQPIPGPSSARMEYVPTAEYPAGHSNFESGFAQTLHQWPMPMLVPAAWTQHQPYPGPANGRAMEE